MLLLFLLFLSLSLCRFTIICAAEPQDSNHAVFLLGEPATKVHISRPRFEALARQSKLLQDMPTTDEPYPLQAIAPIHFDRLCTIATIQPSLFPTIETYKYCLTYTPEELPERASRLFIDTTRVTEVQKNAVTNISQKTLAHLMHDADYLQMDTVLTALLFSFARTTSFQLFLKDYSYNKIITPALVHKVQRLVTDFFSYRFFFTNAFAWYGPTSANTRYIFFSPSGKRLIKIYSDAVEFHAIDSSIVESVLVADPRLVACNQEETCYLIQTNDGHLYRGSFNLQQGLETIGSFAKAKHLAFDGRRSQAILVYSHRYSEVDLTTGNSVVHDAPDGYKFSSVSAFGTSIGLAHQNKGSDLILTRDAKTAYYTCHATLETLSADGRFALVRNDTTWKICDVTNGTVQRLYINPRYVGFDMSLVTFSADNRHVVISLSHKNYKPTLALFETASGMCKQWIVGTGIQCIPPERIHLQGNRLLIFDHFQKKVRKTILPVIDSLPLQQQYLVKMFQEVPHYAYANYSDFYETIPEQFRKHLPEIQVTTRFVTWLNKVLLLEKQT